MADVPKSPYLARFQEEFFSETCGTGEWRTEVKEPGDIRLAYSPLNLVSAAYADLAALVATKAEFKECPGCGRAFLPGSGKQKYHDPQYATRSRQRRWKQGRHGEGLDAAIFALI
jgi:hypothetical protein